MCAGDGAITLGDSETTEVELGKCPMSLGGLRTPGSPTWQARAKKLPLPGLHEARARRLTQKPVTTVWAERHKLDGGSVRPAFPASVQRLYCSHHRKDQQQKEPGGDRVPGRAQAARQPAKASPVGRRARFSPAIQRPVPCHTPGWQMWPATAGLAQGRSSQNSCTRGDYEQGWGRRQRGSILMRAADSTLE